jgi:alpha-ribazole phosphatase
MKIWFIRHGETPGNSEKRYIGRTDEPLSLRGIIQAQALGIGPVSALFVSPLRRCVQTAQIIFPQVPYRVCESLRECDFGQFEGKTAYELARDGAYQAWVDGGCRGDIPGGENVEAFKRRCCNAFQNIVKAADAEDTLALVVHGGCIMAILERFESSRSFYEYHIGNCQWILCDCRTHNGIALTITGGALC